MEQHAMTSSTATAPLKRAVEDILIAPSRALYCRLLLPQDQTWRLDRGRDRMASVQSIVLLSSSLSQKWLLKGSYATLRPSAPPCLSSLCPTNKEKGKGAPWPWKEGLPGHRGWADGERAVRRYKEYTVWERCHGQDPRGGWLRSWHAFARQIAKGPLVSRGGKRQGSRRVPAGARRMEEKRHVLRVSDKRRRRTPVGKKQQNVLKALAEIKKCLRCTVWHFGCATCHTTCLAFSYWPSYATAQPQRKRNVQARKVFWSGRLLSQRSILLRIRRVAGLCPCLSSHVIKGFRCDTHPFVCVQFNFELHDEHRDSVIKTVVPLRLNYALCLLKDDYKPLRKPLPNLDNRYLPWFSLLLCFPSRFPKQSTLPSSLRPSIHIRHADGCVMRFFWRSESSRVLLFSEKKKGLASNKHFFFSVTKSPHSSCVRSWPDIAFTRVC